MARKIWTAAEEKRLASAWNAGLAALALAERFGTSRRCIVEKIGQMRARGVELRFGRVEAPPSGGPDRDGATRDP